MLMPTWKRLYMITMMLLIIKLCIANVQEADVSGKSAIKIFNIAAATVLIGGIIAHIFNHTIPSRLMIVHKNMAIVLERVYSALYYCDKNYVAEYEAKIYFQANSKAVASISITSDWIRDFIVFSAGIWYPKTDEQWKAIDRIIDNIAEETGILMYRRYTDNGFILMTSLLPHTNRSQFVLALRAFAIAAADIELVLTRVDDTLKFCTDTNV